MLHLRLPEEMMETIASFLDLSSFFDWCVAMRDPSYRTRLFYEILQGQIRACIRSLSEKSPVYGLDRYGALFVSLLTTVLSQFVSNPRLLRRVQLTRDGPAWKRFFDNIQELWPLPPSLSTLSCLTSSKAILQYLGDRHPVLLPKYYYGL